MDRRMTYRGPKMIGDVVPEFVGCVKRTKGTLDGAFHAPYGQGVCLLWIDE